MHKHKQSSVPDAFTVESSNGLETLLGPAGNRVSSQEIVMRKGSGKVLQECAFCDPRSRAARSRLEKVFVH